jgi:signal transduction histidine kinase/ActR/RegA family two-component response regulator
MGLTGLVAGSGVWATHFIAMLAYLPGLQIGYAPGVTALSLAIAVVGMFAGFAIPVTQPGRPAAVAGGVITGLSIGAMHFAGIDAIRSQALPEWDVQYVVAALVVGALGGAAAFEARRGLTGRAGWTVPATLLLLGIVGLHFTAMTALKLVLDPTVVIPVEVVGRGVLAIATVVLAGGILAAATSLLWMERLGRRSTLVGLRDALDVVSSGLAFFDPAGRLIRCNRAYAELMAGCGVVAEEGVPRQRFVEAGFMAGWRPAGDGDHVTRWNRHVGGERVSASELSLPDGRWIRHESFVTPDGGGVTVLSDVTEQRETARVLAEARDAAEAANRAKSRFLANISHEIRTPLNGVLGVADVLMGQPLTGEQQELVGVIQSSGALLNALLSDLLDLARAEAGVTELRPEPASLGALLWSVRSLYLARAEQKGLSIRVEMAGGADGWAACDGIRLRQVLGNLVSNAVKFTEAGEVVLEAVREGERVTFRVRDTGAGFDPELKASLFGRFQQGDDSSTRRHGGAGLGLAICQEYVRLMGGELDCDSEPGVGSVFAFTVELPALPEPAPAPSEAVMEDDAGRFRVLIVDDNPINRQVLGLILDSVAIEHASAENGLEGAVAAESGGFDAVLMDLQMPVMDGFAAIRRIRAWEASAGRSRMPILIVSANCLQEHVDAGEAAGADGHLSKPVSVAQLLGALEPHAGVALAA